MGISAVISDGRGDLGFRDTSNSGTAAKTLESNVEIGDAEGVGLDEVAARLDEVAHQGREGFLGGILMADPDLQQGARVGVERRLPQLLGVHLAEALVAVDLDAAAADLHDRLDK